MSTLIRRAVPADAGLILNFIRALAAYERAPNEVVATEEDLLRDGFGAHPFFHCLIAEHLGRPAGFALYFFDYSTWMGRPGIYVEDIFVYPEFRTLGIGKDLLARVAAIALESGCRRLKWMVLDWNALAIGFYRAIGAEFLDEWRGMRVSGEALRRLAQGVQSDAAVMADPRRRAETAP